MNTPQSVRTGFVVALWLSFNLIAEAQHPIQPREENVSVPTDGESVPMLDFGGRPVIEVMVNGKGPYRFLFDTGAGSSVLDSSIADELSLKDGAEVQELRVGKVTVRELPARINKITEMLGGGDAPRGVLSASAFPGALVIYDYPAKRVTFRKGTLAAANGRDIFDYNPDDLPSVPVKVAGREVSVHLDTGAPFAVSLPTKYMKELPLSGPAVQKGKAKTHAGALPIYVAPFAGEISIGQFTVATHDLHFTDVVPFGGLKPRGQVGNEALREWVVTLDSHNYRVRIEKAGAK